jgi:hypothetical protein
MNKAEQDQLIERGEKVGIRMSHHDSHSGVMLILRSGKQEVSWDEFRTLVGDVERKGVGVVLLDR